MRVLTATIILLSFVAIFITLGLLAAGVPQPTQPDAQQTTQKQNPDEKAKEILQQAIEATEAIKGAEPKHQVLVGIARAQADAGDQKAARETLRKVVPFAQAMKDPRMKAYAVQPIAEAQVKAGDVKSA